MGLTSSVLIGRKAVGGVAPRMLGCIGVRGCLDFILLSKSRLGSVNRGLSFQWDRFSSSLIPKAWLHVLDSSILFSFPYRQEEARQRRCLSRLVGSCLSKVVEKATFILII